ncbi:hypothetical protein LRY29_02275, partial [Candidatus Saccharibacteria bacterium]|nr:hypothetical protein [Candidatus Saccharibacteria bacterium]
AATSSSQLFRSLGSTIGTAAFGALLTAGVLTQVADLQQTQYIQTLQQSGQVSRIGDVDDPNTLLTLNMPDIRTQITNAADTQFAQLPEGAQQPAQEAFSAQQDEFGDKVTHAFSESLRIIFMTAAGLIAIATALSFMLKERKLHAASPDATPGEL